MTVVRPNSIAGINSITVQTGQALNIHDADGNLIRNIVSNTGVSTFSSLNVGSATTTNTQGISVGTGCSIVSGTVNTLELYTNNSERLRIDSGGRILVGHTANLHDFKLQVVGDDGNASLALSRFTNSSASSILEFHKSRNGTIGSNTIVQDGDTVGVIRFKGTDGSDYAQVADIQSQIDGTPGSNDMPGRLIFGTTADGAQYTTERLRIDKSGRLLIGTTSFSGTYDGINPHILLEGTTYDTSTVTMFCNANSAGDAPQLQLGKSRGTSDGATTILQDDDRIGSIWIVGADGTDRNSAFAGIDFKVDGTPGENDTPGRIEFKTTADGASTPSARLTIDCNGRMLANGATGGNAFVGGDDLIIGNANSSTRSGITLVSHSGEDGGLYFSRGTSSNSDYCKGQIVYNHSADTLKLYTSSGSGSPSSKVTIGGDGSAVFDVGATELDIKGTGAGDKFPLRLFNSDTTSSNMTGIYFGPCNNVAGAYVAGKAEADFTSTANRDAGLEFGTRLDGNWKESMAISAAGYVTKSLQPSFSATINTTTDRGTNGSRVLPFDTDMHDNGGHFDTSNNRFTAPIAGTYYFIASMNHIGDSIYRIRKNGSNVHQGEFRANTDGAWEHGCVAGMIVLASGDYVDVYGSLNTSTNGTYLWNGGNSSSTAWDTFTGWLVH